MVAVTEPPTEAGGRQRSRLEAGKKAHGDADTLKPGQISECSGQELKAKV